MLFYRCFVHFNSSNRGCNHLLSLQTLVDGRIQKWVWPFTFFYKTVHFEPYDSYDMSHMIWPSIFPWCNLSIISLIIYCSSKTVFLRDLSALFYESGRLTVSSWGKKVIIQVWDLDVVRRLNFKILLKMHNGPPPFKNIIQNLTKKGNRERNSIWEQTIFNTTV